MRLVSAVHSDSTFPGRLVSRLQGDSGIYGPSLLIGGSRHAAQQRYAGVALNNIAPAMSRRRKIGSSTGGTSHSRTLKEGDFGI